MLGFFTLSTLALSAISSVSAVAIPRATPPPGWPTHSLEDYNKYHTRYLALGCENQHGKPFFELCCRPLGANQKLSSRPAKCDPTHNNKEDDNDDDDDCEDDDEDDTPAPAPKPATPKPAPAPKPAPKPPVNPAPAPKPASTDSSVNRGGFATFFYQNGVAGACGKVHKDSDFIAAIDERRYGNSGQRSALCGRRVEITNPANGKKVTVSLEDDCPTCNNSNSIDLSTAAFRQIASESQGIVAITWKFI